MLAHQSCTTESDEHSIFDGDGDTVIIERPWKTRVLGDLTDVATLLDCLEVWSVRERELFTLPDGQFVVTWRE